MTTPTPLLWLKMTRPPFLLLTVVACILGTSTAAACGCGLDTGLAIATTVLAVMAHAAGNVLNDFHDARNGADAANRDAIRPFTGGAHLIQTGAVSEKETRDLALVLLVVLIAGGLWLVSQTGGGVFWLGLAGVVLAWAYSAPPLKLMSRGAGELTIALVWFMVIVGADYVQRRQFFVIPASAGFSFGLLAAALLLINSFPDAKADGNVGKRTTVVRLGPELSAVLYLALVTVAHGWLALSAWWQIPPLQALWGLASAPLSLAAAFWLLRHRRQPSRLRPALVLTVAAALVHGLAMSWGFWQLATQH
ncbi:prenyltransferase [Hydrogenophaga sp. 5NK40-0174]|uniref:prenyltransferase n=1 Tax=Hydrogenophaga sp. 5NK40-0174 TaxID=3127649 RepID=UPI00310B442A